MDDLPFFTRLWMAIVVFFQVVFRPPFARAIFPAYDALREGKALPASAPAAAAPAVVAAAPKRLDAAPALGLLSLLQREGRFVDFLQEDVAAFGDADVGAAARVVHEGCRKVLREYVDLQPVMKDAEGAKVTVNAGFDPSRIRLTGNVTGNPPFSGTMKHHGWVATNVRLPAPPTGVDVNVLAAAEVEL